LLGNGTTTPTFFFHGGDCGLPPTHPPGDAEDTECIWAILAGKQLKDGRVENVVDRTGSDTNAIVRCIQNVYATRTSTLKCF